jgi:hypothetical protein
MEIKKVGNSIKFFDNWCFYKFILKEKELVYVSLIVFITNCKIRCNIIRDVSKELIKAIENCVL